MVLSTVAKQTLKDRPRATARSKVYRKPLDRISTSELDLLRLLAEKPLLSGAQITSIRTSSTTWTMRLVGRLERRGLLVCSVGPSQVDVPSNRHYYLTDEGIRALARREGMAPGRFAKKHWLSASRLTTLFNSLDHTKACRQFFVDLSSRARQHPGDALGVWLDEAAACRRYLWHGEVRLLRPDGYGAYRRNDRALPFFLEWDSGNSGIKRHRRKLRNYYDYRAALGYQSFPAVLLVTVRDRLRQLSRAACEVGSCCHDNTLPLLIGVNTEIQSAGVFGCPWWDVRTRKAVSLESAADLWLATS